MLQIIEINTTTEYKLKLKQSTKALNESSKNSKPTVIKAKLNNGKPSIINQCI